MKMNVKQLREIINNVIVEIILLHSHKIANFNVNLISLKFINSAELQIIL